jgi:uncharacterized membrane protein YuzA (DUF378 family)
MLRLAAWPVGLVLVAVVVLVAGGGSDVTETIGLALIGIAGVVAVSLTFLAVGRSEDAERAAAAAAKLDEEPGPPTPPRHDERPAVRRRRPLPPRRPG